MCFDRFFNEKNMSSYIEKVRKLGQFKEWDEDKGVPNPIGDFVWRAMVRLGINESIQSEQLVELLNKGKGSKLIISTGEQNHKLLLVETRPAELGKNEKCIDLDDDTENKVNGVKDIPIPLRAAVYYCKVHVDKQEINKNTVYNILSGIKNKENLVLCSLLYLFDKKYNEYVECDNQLSLIFFTLLWKSLLLGEFYSVTNYCADLQLKASNYNQDNDNDRRIVAYNPSVVQNYTEIETDLKNFCEKIKVKKENDSKSTIITLDVFSLIEVQNQDKTSLFRVLRNLTLLILEMTRLDLYYVTTVENVKKLGLLYEKLRNLQEAIARTGSFDGVKIPSIYDSEEKQKTQDAIAALMFKTQKLVVGMLRQQVPEQDEDIAYRYEFLRDISKDVVGISYGPAKDNGYWNYLNDRNDYWRLGEADFKKEYLVDIRQGQSQGAQHDYDTSIAQEGRKLHFKNQDFFKKVYGEEEVSDNDIADYIEQTKRDPVEKWNPALLVRLVKYIDENKEKMSIETLSNLHEVSRRLKECVFKYQRDDFSAPLYFRPSFEYSFLYRQGDQKNGDKIFFASLLSRPVNIVFLDRFCMKYEHLYQKWMEEKMLVMGKAIINAQKEVREAKEKVSQTEEKVISVSQEVREERGRSLQFLGIFGAFIAFASSIVGLQKVVNNIWEYVLFASTYVLCIFIFALCIFRISWHGDKAYLDKREAIFKKNYRTFRNKDYAKLIKRIAFSTSRYDIGVIVFFILSIVVAYVVFIGKGGGMAGNNDVNNPVSSINVQMFQSSKSEQVDMNGSHLQQVADTLPKTKSDSSVLLLPSSAK